LVKRIRNQIAEVVALRQQLESFTVNTVEDQREKARLFAQAQAKSHDLRIASNLLLATKLNDYKPAQQEAMRQHLLQVVQDGIDISPAYAVAVAEVEKLTPFHWELEFPEVFLRGGFNAFIGNPPSSADKRSPGLMGVPYRTYLINALANGVKGSADICAYFFLRAYSSLRPGGTFGLIATNTIAQGDTREVGLNQLLKDGATLYHAQNNRPWEGTAAVVVNIVHAYKGDYHGTKTLDGKRVPFISALLDSTANMGDPYPSPPMRAKVFKGALFSAWALC
jgi:hypothetical protein